MEKQKHNDEELKDQIYDIYSKYYDLSSNRLKNLYLLLKLVTKWCRYYPFNKQAREIILNKRKKEGESELVKTGLEIFREELDLKIYPVIKRCTEKDKMSKKDFFPYLYKSLGNAINEYYRDQLIEGSLKENRTLKRIKRIIENLKNNLGREPTKDEQIRAIRQKIPELKKEETILDYLHSMANINVKLVRETIIVNDGNEMSILDTIESHHSTYENEILDDSIADIIKDEFEKFINKKEKKTIPYYRAIYTLHIVKTVKNFEKLRPILDKEILDICEKRGKLPTKYKIYMDHHDGDESTAHSTGSQMSNDFINDFEETLKKAISKKYPKINFQNTNINN